MLSLLKKNLNANSFFSNVLVPVILLVCYCSSFAYLSSRFLVEGVTYFFVSRTTKYALLLLVGTILLFLAALITKSSGRLTFQYSKEKIQPKDLLLLLLPLTPIVQYVLRNQATLSPADSIYVLIAFTLFSSFYVFVIPAALGVIVQIRILMALGLAFVFTIASMASISNYFAWFGQGSLKVQLTVFGFVFLVVWFLYRSHQRKLLYLFIMINFVGNSVAPLLSPHSEADASSLPMEENQLLTLVADKRPAITPNIYLLIYDAYVPNETMLAYGIDNSAQETYLSQQGFEIYPHTYSIGPSSITTMSKVLNVSTGFYGDQRRAVSGDGITQTILKDVGYQTYGLFPTDYMFSGYGESYDYSIPERSTPPYIQLLKSIFIGEFRYNIEKVGFNQPSRDQFVETKQRIFANVPRRRMFVYMHSDLPSHSQISGACLPNEVELFEERLTRANIEMKQDVDLIVQNDPDALVIVAGDHGPFLTKNCRLTNGIYDPSEISRLDIQDRYGTFLAIRWPGRDFESYDEITVLQDLFPAVFAYLYQDSTILESKIEPVIVPPDAISGVSVNDGIILGGINDGEPLFLSGE